MLSGDVYISISSFYNSLSLWSLQIYWWSWRYLHQHEVTVQLPVLPVRRKAGQVRCFRSSQKTWEAYVWATEFSLGPPKCQARRYHCSDDTQRRLLTIFCDLWQWEVTQPQGKHCKQLSATPGCQPKVPCAFFLSAFFPAGISPPFHTHRASVQETRFTYLCSEGLFPHHERRQANAMQSRGHSCKMAAAETESLSPWIPSPAPTATAWTSFLPPGGAGRELLGVGQLTTPWDDCTIPVANWKEEFLFGCLVVSPHPLPAQEINIFLTEKFPPENQRKGNWVWFRFSKNELLLRCKSGHCN